MPNAKKEQAGRSQFESGGISRRLSWRYVALGLASLMWVVLRSGPAPRRLVYPCQRVAAANGLGFLAYVASLVASTRLYRCLRTRLPFGRLALLVAGLALVMLLQGGGNLPLPARASPNLLSWTSPDAVSDVFAVTDVPTPTVSLEGGTIPDGVSPEEALHDDGVDALIDLMAAHGTHFYRTAHQPEGIIGRDDVVVVKVNDQWNCGTGADRRRSHTNNDAVKGLLYRIVRHPEGFRGAAIVVDNGQGVLARFDCPDHNNAQDARQSYQDVANAFAREGYDVCTYAWTDIRSHFVDEYVSGDVESGYVLVQDGAPGADQLSYPKFEVACGSGTYQISMRYGLWDGTTYDDTRLKMINFPIVKRHSMAGATIAVKNYIGFLTTADLERRFGDSTTMHGFFWGYETGSDYGLLGRQLALIRRADLNVVDAIWVNPVSSTGGAEYAVRDDVLLASRDPFAVDYYSSVYLLLPHLVPGSDAARDADARHPGGEFRGLLMTNEDRARMRGMSDVIDLDDRLTAEEELAQFNVFVADASAPQEVTLSLTVEPAAHAIQIGQTAVYTLSPVIDGGYARPVTLTLSGAPSETAASFVPNPVVPPETSSLTITTTSSTITGTYLMTVTGTAGALTDTVHLTLGVSSEIPHFALSISPTIRVAEPNQVVSYTTTVRDIGGLGQPVTLAAVGLPAGVEATWSLNPVTPGDASTLTLSISSDPPFGDHPFHIVGMSGTQTVTENARLTILYPFRNYLPILLE
jgi:hypothetical protein